MSKQAAVGEEHAKGSRYFSIGHFLLKVSDLSLLQAGFGPLEDGLNHLETGLDSPEASLRGMDRWIQGFTT